MPLVANVGISLVTSVPNGTVATIDVLLIVAVTSAPSPILSVDKNANDVMSFDELGAIVTVTVYVWVELSAATTVYITALVKSFAVMPLACTAPPTLTVAPLVVNVATSADTFVP
jgi:hypothetical protein